MKKVMSSILSLLFAFSAIPMGTTAETVRVERGAESWSRTYTRGDVNCDGSISIADAVGLQKYLITGEKDRKMDYDVNFDGKLNVYDMTALRRNIVNPENAVEMTLSIDVLESNAVLPENGVLVKSTQELDGVLNGINTEKYISKYDDEFFSKNNLMLGVITQNAGEGIMYTVGNPVKTGEIEYNGESFNGIAIPVSSNYENNIMLYPQTKTLLLAQVTIPKCCSESDCIFTDLSDIFAPDYSACTYSSPDGKHEYYITQSSFLLMSDADVYIDNHDGTFEHICSLVTDDGHNPFDDKGEWTLDENGNSVFTNGDSYRFTWYDDRVIIDYTWEESKWTSETIYF